MTRAGEVFIVFLRLGLTSFGGPVAHLGYFREALVERRRWLSERAYADIVALCQFLPGPASSQVGMAIGLQRAGVLGLVAAWLGFTLPSAVVMTAFAFGVTGWGSVTGAGWLIGVKAAAVAVVAHAVLSMARTLAPDARRATIAVGALAGVLLVPGALSQVAVILAGAVVGLAWLERSSPVDGDDEPVAAARRGPAVACLALFAALLALLPWLSALTQNPTVALFDVFYRAGSLVFGGGHVVLPLLEVETVPTGLVTHDSFLAGYGAAQAVPGPLFTFASYLGALTAPGAAGLAAAGVATVAIFLPSALLVLGAMPFWQQLRHQHSALRALAGINASVVGILAAALYSPVFTQAVTGPQTMVLAAVALVALTKWRVPAWAVVLGAAAVGALWW